MTKTQELIHAHFARLEPAFDQPLAPLTYMKIGGPAEVLFNLKETADIVEVVTFAHQHQLPLTVLGGASNVVISDRGLKGVILMLSNDEYEVLNSTDHQHTIIRAGAGFKTSLLVGKTVADGLTGLEYFLGVPGKIGGAIYNNAHYLADLMGEKVRRVQVITPENQLQWLTQTECQFKYDDSIFQHTKHIILEVEFQLTRGTAEASQQMIKEATLYRAQTQPLGVPSSGCYFRNTPNTSELARLFPQFAKRPEIPSGFLIDQAGLKGEKVGGVEVSQKHAAFFINTGKGTSEELRQLAERVKQRIRQKYHVELQEEVFFLESEEL